MIASRPVRPWWGAVEIVALLALFYSGLWLIGPRVETHPAAVAAYWLWVGAGSAVMLWLSPIVLHQDPPALRGWALPGVRRSDPGALRNAWKSYALFTVAAAVLLILVAVWRDPRLPEGIQWGRLWVKLGIYTVLGPAQALAFFGYLQTRIRTMVAPDVAPGADPPRQFTVGALTASVFALIHLPNYPLMALVFVTGLGWSWLFFARPNVLLLGFSHAVLGTILQHVVMMHTRIGPFYAEPHHYAFVSAVPGLKALLTGAS